MIKRNADYWMRHGTTEELFEYFQNLVVKNVVSINAQRNFGEESDMEENNQRPTHDFQNLMPIINSSSSDSDYLQYVLSFITNNLTDLSAITNFLDIGKFKQQRRIPLVDEFSVDSNLLEIVNVQWVNTETIQ